MAERTVRIASWNLWWRFGPWEQRQGGIESTLADVDADVVCLQEVWAEEGGDDQAERLAERLGGYHVARSPHRFWEGFSFGNAVLARWPVACTRTQALPEADGGDSHRSLVWAEVDAPFGRLPVLSTHLEFRYDASPTRQAQAAAVARFVAEHRGDPDAVFPPVVTGDLNAEPHSDELRMLTGRSPVPVPGLMFHDAWEAAGDGSPGYTWWGANPHLADATWPDRRLDYVLVGWPRPRPVGNPVACRVAGDAPVAGVWPSDHLAVVADLRAE